MTARTRKTRFAPTLDPLESRQPTSGGLIVENVGANTLAFLNGSNLISNGSFEDRQLQSPGQPGNFAYGFGPGAWTGLGLSGYSGNGTLFTSGNPDAPDGNQVAFLYGNAGDSISQTFQSGDVETATLSLKAAQSAAIGQQHQVIDVLVNGSPVGAIVPTSTSYADYSIDDIALKLGANTIEFKGVGSGQNTALLDGIILAKKETPHVQSASSGAENAVSPTPQGPLPLVPSAKIPETPQTMAPASHSSPESTSSVYSVDPAGQAPPVAWHIDLPVSTITIDLTHRTFSFGSGVLSVGRVQDVSHDRHSPLHVESMTAGRAFVVRDAEQGISAVQPGTTVTFLFGNMGAAKVGRIVESVR